MKSTENGLVQRIVKALAFSSSHRLPLGAGDDAALLTPRPGYQIILTSDWFLEGRHFLPSKHPADSIGWKCLARAISDVAAMGGQPRCFLLNVALPDAFASATKSGASRWLHEFLSGLRIAARRFACPAAGGDTTQASKISISITVIGEVRISRAVLRSGAQPGDRIFVSGSLGQAELGLRLLRCGPRIARANDPALQKHLYPQPRLALGKWLADQKLATAMMDLSDGLSNDLPRLCAASGVGARIAAAAIPSPRLPSSAAKLRFDPLDLALNGGDDYELLFAVRPNKLSRIPRSHSGIPLTPIGEIVRGRGLRLRLPNGRETALIAGGWDPFRR
jgi:thiamine-monophosphate kinase